MVLLTVAVGGLAGAITWGLRLHRSNGETAHAEAAAREIAARLHDVPFEQIFTTWSAAPNVEVPELNPRPDDPDGLVGRLIFPTVDVGGVPRLREDVVMPALGMPRDLDASGGVDLADHSLDYVILPVTVRLEWRGAAGDASLDLHLVLAP